jgi:putative endonuclease
MRMRHTDIGLWGEQVAEAYLSRHGYQVIARRWRALRGDIDLVALKSNEVVFVEVKTRVIHNAWVSAGNMRCGAPEDSVTPAKQRQLERLATVFMQRYDQSDRTHWRINVIAVEKRIEEGIVRIRHYKDLLLK